MQEHDFPRGGNRSITGAEQVIMEGKQVGSVIDYENQFEAIYLDTALYSR